MNEKESPITPTVGRIVLVRGPSVLMNDPTRELPAIVTRVWGQNCIDVHTFGPIGLPCANSVMFDDSDDTTNCIAWRWMPYQVQVAKERDPVTGTKGPELTFLDRLRVEASELEDRRQKLIAFISSDAFRGLSQAQQVLLEEQEVVMTRYGQILVRREYLSREAV